MFQVLIATTEETVEVGMISRESPGVPCCVTEGLATTDELPISRAYQKFVARPTGVVGKFTRHESYRLCLSRSIDNGASWQLPVYLAHWLKHRGQLYERLRPGAAEAPDAIIWATGEVNYHLQVGPVCGIAQKLSHLARWLDDNLHEPMPVIVAVPDDAAAAARAYFENLPEHSVKARVISVAEVGQVERILHELDPGGPSADDESAATAAGFEKHPLRFAIGASTHRRRAVGFAVAILFSTVLIASVFQGRGALRAALSDKMENLPDGVVLESRVLHGSEKAYCSSITENGLAPGEGDYERRELSPPDSGVLVLHADESACLVVLEIHNRGTENLSGLMIPADKALSAGDAAQVVPLDAGKMLSTDLLDRTEYFGMKRTAGARMRLLIAAMPADELKVMLSAYPVDADDAQTAGFPELPAERIWVQDIQAVLENTGQQTVAEQASHDLDSR